MKSELVGLKSICTNHPFYVLVDTDNYESVEPNSDDKLRDLSFTDIALRKVPAPILTQLPENASNLNIDSFVPTELTSQNIKLTGVTKKYTFQLIILKVKCIPKTLSHITPVLFNYPDFSETFTHSSEIRS